VAVASPKRLTPPIQPRSRCRLFGGNDQESTGFSQSEAESVRSKNRHLPAQTSAFSEPVGTQNHKSLGRVFESPRGRLERPDQNRYISGSHDIVESSRGRLAAPCVIFVDEPYHILYSDVSYV
jgi:hypothetical protein